LRITRALTVPKREPINKLSRKAVNPTEMKLLTNPSMGSLPEKNKVRNNGQGASKKEIATASSKPPMGS